MRSNGPSRWIRPFATQLSATPPAMHRSTSPVSSWAAPRHREHRVLGVRLHRRGKVGLPLGEGLTFIPPGPPRSPGRSSLTEGRGRRTSPSVAHRCGWTRRSPMTQAPRPHPRTRFAVRRETHELVFPVIRREPAPRSHERVQQTERVRESLLLEQRQPVGRPMADGRGGPLTDAVDGEHRQLSNGDGKKAAAAWLRWCSTNSAREGRRGPTPGGTDRPRSRLRDCGVQRLGRHRRTNCLIPTGP